MSNSVPPKKPSYHHGDLREALLNAAEAEIGAEGIESFSLRRVAKRAAVSHAAPAHHFRDASGLLTALAAVGYRRFVDAQKKREAIAQTGDAMARLLASGLGLIDFAQSHPALFRLIFSSKRLDYADADLHSASRAAFTHLCDNVHAVTGAHPYDNAAAMLDAVALWSAAHGLADLLISGQLMPMQKLSKAERETAIISILERALPKI